LDYNTGSHHAFLWENDTFYDLNNYIPEDSGWILTGAQGINDEGYIVGYGISPNGEYHGFLLTPIPEPCTLSLILLGGTILFQRRRKYHYQSGILTAGFGGR